MVAEEAEDDWATGWALHVLTVSALMNGEVRASLPLFERALSVTERDPDLADLRLLLQINHAVAIGNLDQYKEAIAAARAVCELTERAGSMRQAQVRTVLGELLMDSGSWDDALLSVTAVPDDRKDPAGACCDFGIAAVISFHRGTRTPRRRTWPRPSGRRSSSADASSGRWRWPRACARRAPVSRRVRWRSCSPGWPATPRIWRRSRACCRTPSASPSSSASTAARARCSGT